MLAELVDYALIGHSERKKNFGENLKTASKKIKMATEAGIVPILCATDIDEIPKEIPGNLHLLYEPLGAISQDGVYHPETPPKAQKTIAEWKAKLKNVDRFLYGGSVNPSNIAQFLAQPDIKGVVVGHASLDPNSFWELINNVSA
jgi:triosephosphate isomerase